jgi:hypothetical protein
VTRAVGIRHKHADVLADSFLLEIAELPLRGATEELHDAVAVDDNHGIGNSLQNRLQMALARPQGFFEPFLLVDIERNAAEMMWRAFLVLDETAADADPMHNSGRTVQSV